MSAPSGNLWGRNWESPTGSPLTRKEISHVGIADRTHPLSIRLPIAHQALASHSSRDGPRTGDRVSGYQPLYLPNAAPTYWSVGKWPCRTRGEARRYGRRDGLGRSSLPGVLFRHPNDGSRLRDDQHPPLPG